MPNISAPETSVAVTGASATGTITVANATLFKDAKCWLFKTDGSASARVKIVSLISTTGCKAVRFPNDDDGQFPGYGYSDLSAFNTGSAISMDRQVVPVDPAFSKIL
jgi:hypothetical protein